MCIITSSRLFTSQKIVIESGRGWRSDESRFFELDSGADDRSNEQKRRLDGCSLPCPGRILDGDREAAARMSRRGNEYAADLVRNHPGRFGHFAIIPLPDTDASLREIEYAYSVLKADGITLLTSYDDKWLGHPDYQPVFEELNRRKAVVFVHPTTPLCCRTLLPDVPPGILQIPQDTTRAVTNLVFTGTLAKFHDIRFIFSHAGGDVPMVVGRMQQYAPKSVAEKAPNGIEYELKRHYYDIAGTAYGPAIAALKSLVPTTQILFGSDNPFRAPHRNG